MTSLNIKSYLEGSKDEIEAVEAHRKASPFKVGFEPKYDQKIRRLPRKKKKELKTWYRKKKVRVSLASSYVLDRFTDKRLVRGAYLGLFKMMRDIKYKRYCELVVEE